jgi:uncharacterized protein
MTIVSTSFTAPPTPASAAGEPRQRRILVPLVIVLAAALGLLGTGGYLGASQAIGEHPEWRKMIHTPADYDLSSEVVSFSSLDGIPLKAWWLPAQPAGPGVTEPAPASAQAQPAPPVTPGVNIVMAHGRDMNRSGMLARAAFLVRHGYNVLDVDLRDHGESGGNYITPGSREALDILGGVAYLRSRGERGPIVAFGYSYGAVAALHAAAQCADVDAVVADSAFISPDDVLKNVVHQKTVPLKFRILLQFARLPLLDRSSDLMFRLRSGVKLDRNKASALAAVRRIHQQPILFISGEKDWLAPTQNARRMYQEAPTVHKDLVVIPGANHNTTYYGAMRPLYESNVLDFLAQNVSRRAPFDAACTPDPY